MPTTGHDSEPFHCLSIPINCLRYICPNVVDVMALFPSQSTNWALSKTLLQQHSLCTFCIVHHGGGGAVSLVGMCHGPGICRSLGTPPRGPRRTTTVLEMCISMNFQMLRPRFQKGQWLLNQSLPRGGIMTPGLHYGILGTNAGEHSYGDGYGCLSCLHRVPIRCRKP
jgi:hypothetical protein